MCQLYSGWENKVRSCSLEQPAGSTDSNRGITKIEQGKTKARQHFKSEMFHVKHIKKATVRDGKMVFLCHYEAFFKGRGNLKHSKFEIASSLRPLGASSSQ